MSSFFKFIIILLIGILLPLFSIATEECEWSETYHYWWKQHFSEQNRYNLGLPNSDPDNDKINNFQEYAFLLSPVQSNLNWCTISGSSNITFEYLRPKNIIDIDYNHWCGKNLFHLTYSIPNIFISNNVEKVFFTKTDQTTYFFKTTLKYTQGTNSPSIICWGDSLTDGGYPPFLRSLVDSNRDVFNMGIGAETSTQIKERMLGQLLKTPESLFVADGESIDLKTEPVIPPRLLMEHYRQYWEIYASRVDKINLVEFFINGIRAGQVKTPTKTFVTTDIVTFPTHLIAPNHPFSNGEKICFYGEEALPSNIVEGRAYYVQNSNNDFFEISEYPTNTPLTLLSDTITNILAISGYKMSWIGSGENINVKARTFTEHDGGVTIIWIGANNITQTNQIEKDIQTMIAHIKPLERRFIILTCLNNAVSAPKGTYGYTCLTNLNHWIKTTYPANALDVYSKLRSSYNPNNSQDIEDIKNGVIPSSLRIDNIHLNTTGNQLIASWVYQSITNRNW